jgi:hypothetical protein
VLRTSTDQELAILFRENNPGLFNDSATLIGKLNKLDSDIDTWLKNKPKEWEILINILLQARNAIAYLLHIEPREVDCNITTNNFVNNSLAIPQEKFVILLCNSEIVANAIKQVLPTELSNETRFKIMNCNLCIQAILTNHVAGIVDFNYKINYTQGHLDYSLRHGIKTFDGWNQERADSLILPPLFVTKINQVFKGFEAALEMENGTYHTSEVFLDNVNLADYRSSFLSRMIPPSSKLEIVIVDDNKSCSQGLLYLLEIWPELNARLIYDFGICFPDLGNADVILLDHDLGHDKYNGGDLLRHWKSTGFNGIVVSTTGGDPQSYGDYHFYKKNDVTIGNLNSCNQFIALINQIIKVM